MKSVVMGILLLLPFGSSYAACHDIVGDWAFTFDEVINGDTIAGLGRGTFTPTRLRTKLWENYLGETTKGFASGPYTVKANCTFVWNFVIEGTFITGRTNGVIINQNKMIGVYKSTAGRSGRVIGERMQSF